ncbi:MAG: DUF429 domain-containing protein [Gaiellales bacterium]
MDVAGVDWSRAGWVAVVLRDGAFLQAALASSFGELREPLAGCACIAVDVPIGLPDDGPRRADVEAREFVGPRRSSIFASPPHWAIEAADYPAALAQARDAGAAGISAQAYALRRQIAEVAEIARADDRIHEAHPEVSFRAMSGDVLTLPKRTWGGFTLRRRLLSAQGIAIPDELADADRAGIDDVLDAAAAAWTSQRIAGGTAESFPRAAESGRSHRIWF